jgi:hypothetical protein
MRRAVLSSALFVLTACSSSGSAPVATTFLDGTAADAGIAVTVNTSGNTLLLLQTGSPATRKEIPLGTSSTITPVGFAIRGQKAIVPLGNAASVALVNLSTGTIDRFFTFPGGNATGAAWVDDSTVLVTNPISNVVGRFRIGQASTAIADTLRLADFPTDVQVSNGRAFVVSSRLDANYVAEGNGVVTEVAPSTLTVVRTFDTGGTDPQAAAFGADGKLYVTNAGDFGSGNGSLTTIDVVANRVVGTSTALEYPGFIAFDRNNRAFIASFSVGTYVYDATAKAFLRGNANPLCAPITSAGVTSCRGASGAAVGPNGKIYTAFFGSASTGQGAYLFTFDGSTFALTDSIAVPLRPSYLSVQSFPR